MARIPIAKYISDCYLCDNLGQTEEINRVRPRQKNQLGLWGLTWADIGKALGKIGNIFIDFAPIYYQYKLQKDALELKFETTGSLTQSENAALAEAIKKIKEENDKMIKMGITVVAVGVGAYFLLRRK